MREGWRHVALGDVLSLDIDAVPVDADCEYQLAGVYSFGRGLFEREPLAGKRTSYKVLHRLLPDRLVMSKLKAWEGALAVVTSEFDGFVLSPEFPTFKAGPDLDPRFLSLLCSHPGFWIRLQAESQGMGGRRERVHPTRLLNVSVDLPPVAEQRRIVDLVASLDRCIDRSEAVRTSAQVARSSLLVDHFDAVPLHEMHSLADLASARLGKMLSKASRTGDGEYPYVRNADVQWDELRLDTLNKMYFSERERNEFALHAGDVLICEGGEVGRTAVVAEDLEDIFFQKAIHRVRCGPRLVPRYLMLYMRYCAIMGRLADYSTQLTIQHLTGEKLRTLPVPAPSLAIQERFVFLLDGIGAVEHASAAEADALRLARDALLADLLSGDHQIPESYDRLLESA